MSSSLLLVAAFILLTAVLVKYLRSTFGGKVALPLPPGPKQQTLTGAAMLVDSKRPWVSYKHWGDIYGPDGIISFHFFGKPMVILNSEKVAGELLERRSRIYADRPPLSTIPLSGWDYNFVLSRYGARWRSQRRLFQQSFREQKVSDYRPTQLDAAHRLAINMADSPASELWDLITLCTASGILMTLYGYEVNDIKDPLFRIVDETVTTGLPLFTPEKAMVVDRFPFVKWLPTFLPGTSVVRECLIARQWMQKFMDVPYEVTMEKLQSDPTFTSVVSDTLQRSHGCDRDKFVHDVKSFASTAFVGGVETSASVLQSLVIALLLYPDVQRRAQADIDAVVGKDRLPNFEDRPLLPYIDAMIRETMRWAPVLPLALSHAVMEDDEYEGYSIPKGTTVVANIWAISRDSGRYPEPETFRPERFIAKDGKLSDDTVKWSFGWGRRICPGRYLAQNAVWAAATTMLVAYSFQKETDQRGNPIDFIPAWTTGLTSRPQQVPLRVVPRIDRGKLEKMIEQSKA
ncbi:cytochrome P450 [Coniophora puteana RWD-64-598 SS2]|uniref:Cytochrome P450 n=1 Tax=Coniophora puteana (strain RWD-64-598) TaxID=741705 RepID=A0A5M3MYV6_CONPW|nr:cytochrome P450 [Coniophora puteana RWD-64-598 SS2]EIW84343.1 cytochrome P450 [Coniophora puteana RWD-64-598 SS2]